MPMVTVAMSSNQYTFICNTVGVDSTYIYVQVCKADVSTSNGSLYTETYSNHDITFSWMCTIISVSQTVSANGIVNYNNF